MKRIVALILCCLLLAGCAPKMQPNGICFTDALGREVSVPEKPERVAALLGSFADIWVLSGGSLCAAVEDAWEDFDLRFEGIDLGGAHSPSVEKLLSAAPDFVLASASTASNVNMLEILTGAGITVAYFDVDNFYDYLHMLDICTDITGRKDLYEKNGVALAEQIEGIKQAAASVPEEKKTVLLLRASSGFVKAKGSEGTVLGELLADMGCINIADSEQALLEALSVEAVISRQPYGIFVVTMGSDTQAAEESLNALFRENPAWGRLEAVEQGRVFIMDKTLFNLKPNDRWAEAYEKLYEILSQF